MPAAVAGKKTCSTVPACSMLSLAAALFAERMSRGTSDQDTSHPRQDPWASVRDLLPPPRSRAHRRRSARSAAFVVTSPVRAPSDPRPSARPERARRPKRSEESCPRRPAPSRRRTRRSTYRSPTSGGADLGARECVRRCITEHVLLPNERMTSICPKRPACAFASTSNDDPKPQRARGQTRCLE